MKHARKAVLAVSVVGCALLSPGWSEQGGISLSVESAQARVGRPLTPVSVAGVARRQVRRGYYGAGYGAGLAGAAVVGTAAAVAAAPYYGGMGTAYYARDPYAAYGYPVQDYAARNGFLCRPGTMTRLEDGRMYPCQ